MGAAALAPVAVVACAGGGCQAAAGAVTTRIATKKALSTSTKKAIRSQKRLIKEHRAKLKEFKKDPDKFDNKGFLKMRKMRNSAKVLYLGELNT